jgi:hypothetical protein
LKRIATILCLLVLPVVIESACEQGGEQFKFTIKDFSVTANMLAGDYNAPASPSIAAKNLILTLHVDNATVLNLHKSTMAAYADQPAPISIEAVTAFAITSDSVLTITTGERFLPGQDLQSLFYDLDNFAIKNDQGGKIYDLDYLFQGAFGVPKNQKHNFKLSITLDDGRRFDVETGIYELIP